MREIKLRAWDNGKMWYPETKTVDSNDTFFALYNNKEKTIGWGLYDMILEYRVVSGEYDAVLMQFTGLKDKNNKDIFESDVVKHEFEGEYGPYEHRDTVEYYEGAFYPVCQKPGSEFEVIGNIYENPELL